MKIKLPILFNTDSTQSMQNAEIDFDLRLCEVRPMIFFEINALASYFENGIEYSQIWSNGESFYCTLKTYEVEKLIDKQKQLEFIQ